MDLLDRYHTKYLEAAKAVAMSSTGVGQRRIKVGAVIVHRTKGIIAATCNTYKTHPKLLKFYPFVCLHAEARALLMLGNDTTKKCDMYVALINGRGHIGNARPCERMCMPMILESDIENIYYTKQKSLGVINRIDDIEDVIPPEQIALL